MSYDREEFKGFITDTIETMPDNERNDFAEIVNRMIMVKESSCMFDVKLLKMIEMKLNITKLPNDNEYDYKFSVAIFVHMFYNSLIDTFQTTFDTLIKEYKKTSKSGGFYDKSNVKKIREIYDRDCRILIHYKKQLLPKSYRKIMDKTKIHTYYPFPAKKQLMLDYLDNLEISDSMELRVISNDN